MITLPQRIKIISDDTELELIEAIKEKKIDVAGKYEYVKAKVLKGTQITLPLSQIEYLKSSGLLKIIEKKQK